MDLARQVYDRDLKIAAMREIDSGKTVTQVARQLQLNPKLLEKWRADWRARGDIAFPGNGRKRIETSTYDENLKVSELERKIGQLTMENDFLKKALAHFRDRHPPAVVSGAATSTRQSGNPPKKNGRR
jgi:transposase